MNTSSKATKEGRASRHPVLEVGISVGTGLASLMLLWLLVANRFASLDRFAPERNLAASIAAGILTLIPVCRFLKSPRRLFLSGSIAWTMLALVYGAMESRFPALELRMSAFHMFILGMLVYGLFATFLWVTHLVLSVRHMPITASRRRLP